MSELNNEKTTIEYIQFSKRVTKWGIICVSFMLILCVLTIAIFGLSSDIATTISRLYSAYVTIMGVTIGAYQGNSSLEKWTKAHYNYTQVFDNKDEDEDQG